MSAKDSARRLAVELQIAYAENDAITLSQQLLKIIPGLSAGFHCGRTAWVHGLASGRTSGVEEGP